MVRSDRWLGRQDHAGLPRLSLLSAAGELGHDDPGLVEEFVRSTDSAGQLGGCEAKPGKRFEWLVVVNSG